MDQQISFIEKQFPVSKVSKESYKERKAVAGQTLTGLGKWWGRKPLILVRAAILGCLMPTSDNSKLDMEIFLKILSMDDDGLLDRKQKRIPVKELFNLVDKHTYYQQFLHDWFELDNGKRIRIKQGQDRNLIEKKMFKTLSYDEKLKYCLRPEQLDNLREDSWNVINHHLGTDAACLNELFRQLSVKRYGHIIRIGDSFCGGGSIPFETARLGLNSYGSDLNPIASLLSWASINILGANTRDLAKIKSFQRSVFETIDEEVTSLGIEHNEAGDRAISYIYCVEAHCPECNVKVPLAPSWVLGKDSKTIAQLKKNGNGYDIEIKMGVASHEMKSAAKGTITRAGMLCPNCRKTTPISVLRKDRVGENGDTIYGLRQWDKEDFDFRTGDVFSERLYAIKYEPVDGGRYYRAPQERDLENEMMVRRIVDECFVDWQTRGLIPGLKIESGHNTDQLIRERGWTHWNHLFNARQLLTARYFYEKISNESNFLNKVAGILGLNKSLDWNARLCIWNSGTGNEKLQNVFTTQALNTLFNYGCRSFSGTSPSWFFNISHCSIPGTAIIDIADARDVNIVCDFWITDPPYADAVNYHELSEFFLAWDKKLLEETFPEWYTDSKRILAVRGDEQFSQSMIDIYTNLTNHMPDDGMQIVMFTHSDPAVWAQLALIMWKSGLKVTAAWNIATETESGGLKDGNYVKGTVLLVLRKQVNDEIVFLDEINADIRAEVRCQIKNMMELDDKEEPNFSDPDFVLAAYAASLKVLTQYKTIEDLNLDYELDLAINDPTRSAVVRIIENAKRIAYDCVVPSDFEGHYWRDLTNAEKFYIKGLESEKRGNYQVSTYQEFARGFNIGGYTQLMQSSRANSARLRTPTEIGSRAMNDVPDFENSLMRTIFMGIYAGIQEDQNPQKALGFIKNEMPDYWEKREMIKRLLHFIKDTKDIDNMAPHWRQSAEMAEMLFSLVSHDSI